MVERAFVDGCFDGYHYGHVNFLFKAKQLCKTLCVGTHTDEEILKFKGIETINNYKIRYYLLTQCRFIDELYPRTPYAPSIETIDKLSCEKYIYSSNVCMLTDGTNALEGLIKDDRLIITDRTEYISTTLIKDKTRERTIDTDYLHEIFENVKINNYTKDDELMIIENDWDFITIEDIEKCIDLKKRNPNTKLIINVKSNGYLTKLDHAIILSSFKFVDGVFVN